MFKIIFNELHLLFMEFQQNRQCQMLSQIQLTQQYHSIIRISAIQALYLVSEKSLNDRYWKFTNYMDSLNYFQVDFITIQVNTVAPYSLIIVHDVSLNPNLNALILKSKLSQSQYRIKILSNLYLYISSICIHSALSRGKFSNSLIEILSSIRVFNRVYLFFVERYFIILQLQFSLFFTLLHSITVFLIYLIYIFFLKYQNMAHQFLIQNYIVINIIIKWMNRFIRSIFFQYDFQPLLQISYFTVQITIQLRLQLIVMIIQLILMNQFTNFCLTVLFQPFKSSYLVFKLKILFQFAIQFFLQLVIFIPYFQFASRCFFKPYIIFLSYPQFLLYLYPYFCFLPFLIHACLTIHVSFMIQLIINLHQNQQFDIYIIKLAYIHATIRAWSHYLSQFTCCLQQQTRFSVH
ncbi:unnamed protein product (macronuclear) [Paramecium tetraurelia]|uniref:Transmembrane protein n=1 Tax=Paramecium tetraurelia TaxID=5888 RepID=A0BVL2_PARTE|nr:uncharacterized protein GSPATT00005825001 [Paramecium tetraurelia]CAK62579.1 unnamed protein product [Paramecium tetraurelia]|eukprot:XP_001429977.1 hypothetical protein (macronuclear) [Paramecium tetraurelia strain d4-2]